MAMKISLCLALGLFLSACGDNKPPKEDKAKEAVRDVITRDFQYYQTAKDKIGDSEKREAERREQEKAIE